jgi:hypothetical protein
MARDAFTYRAARRNDCLRRTRPGVWGDHLYYSQHRATYHRRTVLSRRPSRYHPLAAIGEYLVSLGKRWGRKKEPIPVALG